MRTIAMVVCLIAFLGAAIAADTAKAPKSAKAPKAPSMEQLTCRTGPNDRQVRMTVVVVKQRPMEFAYYSRLGNKVCSIHAWRGDAHTKWEDAAGKALVKLFEGNAELEYQPGHLKLKFLDVSRMHYCGMYGELNGTVEASSRKSECDFEGVLVDGVLADGAR